MKGRTNLAGAAAFVAFSVISGIANPTLAQTTVNTSQKPMAAGSVVGQPTVGAHTLTTSSTAQPSPPHPAHTENYYGDNPPGTYKYTDETGVDVGTSPAATPPILNPNQLVATGRSPAAAAGAVTPLLGAYPSIAVPPAQANLAENPQESISAFVWILVFTVLLIGSIFGLIRWTQPGGVA